MKADAQVIPRNMLLKSGRPLEVFKIEDMFCSTPVTHPYQGDLPKHRNDASRCSSSPEKIMAVMVRLYMEI